MVTNKKAVKYHSFSINKGFVFVMRLPSGADPGIF